MVGDGEADEIGMDIDFALAGFFEQHGDLHRFGAALAMISSRAKVSVRPDSRMSSTMSTSRPSTGSVRSRATWIAAAGAGAATIAGKRHEIDLRAHAAREVQGADQVGGEDEAAAQQRDDHHIGRQLRGDFLGQRGDAPGDFLGGDQRERCGAVYP